MMRHLPPFARGPFGAKWDVLFRWGCPQNLCEGFRYLSADIGIENRRGVEPHAKTLHKWLSVPRINFFKADTDPIELSA